MIHFALFALIAWLIAVVLIALNEDTERLVGLVLELEDAERAAMDAEHRAAAHLRTVQHLQYELDQRNGWQSGPADDILAPYSPPVGLTLMEEYQPHVIEWLPFSLN